MAIRHCWPWDHLGGLHGVFPILQEKSMVARAEKLAKLRAGEAVGNKRTPEGKELAKSFYKQLITDSDYVGEDYEVFSQWLGNTQAA